jgi:PiT family inorganic phosphate transporter
LRNALGGIGATTEIPAEHRFELRRMILRADSAIDGLDKRGLLGTSSVDRRKLKELRVDLRLLCDYAPSWVIALVALCLGVGTMIGWKRIVITVGEKIGKSHLTYTQGAAAEIVAMSTIGVAAFAGLPVSTTHVLSSGIAGTMVARKSGLQGKTVLHIALAWIFTLPAAILLSGGLFLALRRIF